MTGGQRLHVLGVGRCHDRATDPDGCRHHDGIDCRASAGAGPELAGEPNQPWGERNDVGGTARQAVDAGISRVASVDLGQYDKGDEWPHAFPLGEPGDRSRPPLHGAATTRAAQYVDGLGIEDQLAR